MTWKTLLLVATCFVGTALGAEPARVDAAAAFARLKALAGEWQARSAQLGSVRLRYEVVAGGSAVLEQFGTDSGNDHSMVTVYHLDGDRLILTHYCMAKNQPRMEAKRFDPAGGNLEFEFVDATNLSGPDAGHMHTAAFRFVDADHFESRWQFFEGGKVKFTEEAKYSRLK
jgi:hypothetical protein